MSKDIEDIKNIFKQQHLAFKIKDSMGFAWIESSQKMIQTFLSIGKKGMTPMYVISENEVNEINKLMDELNALRAQSEAGKASKH